MNRAIGAVFLASTISLSAFENLDFGQIPPPTTTWTDDVPGWQHHGPNGGVGDYWNVNFVNLSGWAEASVVYLDDPQPPWPIFPTPPIDRLFSMAISAFWPLLPDPSITNDLGSAWIGQTGTIETDAPWLALITDYAGPHTAYLDYVENPDYFAVGFLTIYFEGTPVAFTLKDAGTGSVGQPLRELLADLTPFAGQTGELRIGIEGPHSFVIDNIQFIPEPSSFTLLAGPIPAIGAWRMLRVHPKSSAS